MNEQRISQLVDNTADVIPGVYSIVYDSGGKGVEFSEQALKKFTELIAVDCLSYIRQRHIQALDQKWSVDEALNAVEGDIVRGFQILEF